MFLSNTVMMFPSWPGSSKPAYFTWICLGFTHLLSILLGIASFGGCFFEGGGHGLQIPWAVDPLSWRCPLCEHQSNQKTLGFTDPKIHKSLASKFSTKIFGTRDLKNTKLLGANLREIRKKSPGVSGTWNGGTKPYKAILGMGFPLHKPYPYSLYRRVPPF